METDPKQSELSHSEKVEREVAGFMAVAKRNPWLAGVILLLIVGFAGWWVYDHVHGIPALKAKIGEADAAKAKALGTRDDANIERDKAIREKHDALRDRDEVARERDKYFIVYSQVKVAADAQFTNSPPNKRLDLLLEAVAEIRRDIARPRTLSDEARARVVAALKRCEVRPVRLVAMQWDPLTVDLAVLLADVFSQGGFQTGIDVSKDYTKAPVQLDVGYGMADQKFVDAFDVVCGELGVHGILNVTTNVLDGSAFIRLGRVR